MRLLNSSNLNIREFVGDVTPPYVILSHTWDDDEVSFQDMQSSSAREKKGFAKIQKCCAQAIEDGFDWVWVDTCCIDKTSSVELSEAINSMYRWYQRAWICYAYLSDVPGGLLLDEAKFRESKWFTRGWTLQELIAPSFVEFYDSDWREIGTKSSMKELISNITGVTRQVLAGSPPSTCNVAQRMKWASRRVTTRIEDMAYSLMGLFDINMPLLYGEGEKAFMRLQEQIIRSADDYTLFAWRPHAGTEDGYDVEYFGMLARSPRDFCGGDECSQCNPTTRVAYEDLVLDSSIEKHDPVQHLKEFDHIRRNFASQVGPSLTGRGLRICLPILRDTHTSAALAYLHCREGEQMLCIRLYRSRDTPFSVYTRVVQQRDDSLVLLPVREAKKFKFATINVGKLVLGGSQQTKVRTPTSLDIAPLPPCITLVNSWPATIKVNLHHLQNDEFGRLEGTFALSHRLKADEAKSEVFAITLGMSFFRIWCILRTDIEAKSYAGQDWLHLPSSYEWETLSSGEVNGADRAHKQLPSGSLIVVAVKVLPICNESHHRAYHWELRVSCTSCSLANEMDSFEDKGKVADESNPSQLQSMDLD